MGPNDRGNYSISVSDGICRVNDVLEKRSKSGVRRPQVNRFNDRCYWICSAN